MTPPTTTTKSSTRGLVHKLVRMSLLVAMATCCLVPSTSAAATPQQLVEPRTGISFDDKLQRQPLQKWGVRTKGPIKVYAVGQYGPNLFALKMAFTVKAEQLSGALMDALKPRCASLGCGEDDHQVHDFKSMVMAALPNGAKKGTVLLFNTAGGKVTLTVNGKNAGKMPGKAIAKAFAGIYTDSNAVCKMRPVKKTTTGKSDNNSNNNFRMDSEVVRTVGIMAAATLLIMVYFTTPDTKTRVAELNIYPIKSCAQQTVESAVVTRTGFEGDRLAMVVDAKGACCTPRTSSSRLFHVEPSIDMDNDPDIITLSSRHAPHETLAVDVSKTDKTVKVTHNEAPGTMAVSDFGNIAASWLETATGIKGCRLVGIHDRVASTNGNNNGNGSAYKRTVQVNKDQGDPVPIDNAPVSLADEAPFLLCNETSLEDLNKRMVERGQNPVDMRRFRPNIIVKNLAPWEEDTWSRIRIGGKVEFFVWQRCGRCIMTTIDRDSLDRTAEPLATLNTFRERDHGMRNFGMHLVPDPATLNNSDDDDDNDDAEVTVGDVVEVLEYDEERLKEWTEKHYVGST